MAESATSVDAQRVAAPAVAVRLEGLRKAFGDVEAVRGVDLDIADGEFFSHARAVRVGQDHGAADDRRLRAARPPGTCVLGGAGRDADAAVRPRRQHRVPGLRAVPAHERCAQNVAYGLRVKGVGRAERTRRAREALDRVRLAGFGDRQPGAAVRRPAPAGRAGPGPGQPAPGAAARRAARRPRPQAAPADAGRAQGDPARRRHHLRLRHPRPGGGADDERPDRGLQRRRHRAGRHRRPTSTSDPATPFVAGFVGTTNLVDGAAAVRLFGQPGTWSLRPERVRVAGPGTRRRAARAHGRRARCARSSTSARPSGCSSTLAQGTSLVATQPNLATASTRLDDWLGRPGASALETRARAPGGRRLNAHRPRPPGGSHVHDREPRSRSPRQRRSAPGSPRAARPRRSSGGGASATRQPPPKVAMASSLGAGRGRRSTSSPGPATPRTARTTRRSTGCTRSRRPPAARSTSRSPTPPTRW